MSAAAVYLRLPWVPTTNTYYRSVPGLHTPTISKRGRAFRKEVEAAVFDQLGGRPSAMRGDLHVIVDLYPPDKRRRDVDNCFKGLLDALTKAGVWSDDSQVKSLWGRMHEKSTGGRVIVQIEKLAEPT